MWPIDDQSLQQHTSNLLLNDLLNTWKNSSTRAPNNVPSEANEPMDKHKMLPLVTEISRIYWRHVNRHGLWTKLWSILETQENDVQSYDLTLELAESRDHFCYALQQRMWKCLLDYRMNPSVSWMQRWTLTAEASAKRNRRTQEK
jgi:hypothetical protein